MVEITRLVPKENKRLVVVITGHGKGKTTTALGIAIGASLQKWQEGQEDFRIQGLKFTSFGQ